MFQLCSFLSPVDESQEDTVLLKDVDFLRSPSKFTLSDSRRVRYGLEAEEDINSLTKLKFEARKVRRVEKLGDEITSFVSNVSLVWLRSVCREKFGTTDIVRNIISIIKKKSESEMQQDLFGLLGAENMELMGKIMENRRIILLDNYQEESLIIGGKRDKKQFLQSISVTNSKKVKLEKEIEKLQSSIHKRSGISAKEKLAETKKEELVNALKNEVQEIKRKAPVKQKSAIIEILEKYCPELDFDFERSKIDVKSVDKNGYTELQVTPPKRNKSKIETVNISTFPKWARMAFKAIKKLNPIQSKCYKTAFNSGENMLICAPTGCGKTNVALMTVLHEVSKNLSESGKVNLDKFKILYITPMKALASEIVSKFGRRLRYLNIKVREFTGDMRLTKKEVDQTQIIVSTPEKWDVITRKQTDTQLIQRVRLIIFDEIHLLNDSRGPVIECIVARTLRQIEQSQMLVRLVGLSATLPNYEDVATFLRVNHSKGLFYFDASFRPVPLHQHFIGVKYEQMDEVCYDKIIESFEKGYQVMVFVHSRKGTVITGQKMIELARDRGQMEYFAQPKKVSYQIRKRADHSSNRQIGELFRYGVSFHNAGMLRKDKNLVEEMFKAGAIRLLCTTATLAWGVNLPAHTVIIRGTEIYSAEKSMRINISVLDVMQIFGRAGRPQFDTTGLGVIITKPKQAPKYLAECNNAIAIESQLQMNLENHLNAEIVLGSVTNIREAIRWLTYTYLFVRIQKNPHNYGITRKELLNDPQLGLFRRKLVAQTARTLDMCKLIRYDELTGALSPTYLGRIASHYYIHFETIEMFNLRLKPMLEEKKLLNLICDAREFKQVKVRRDDHGGLEYLQAHHCPVEILGAGILGSPGKVNVLLQSYISQAFITDFALVSDCAFVIDNAGRIIRAMLEIGLQKRWSLLIDKLITLNKCLARRFWKTRHPLRQFRRINNYSLKVFEGKNRSKKEYTVETLYDMDPSEIDETCRSKGIGVEVLDLIEQLPFVSIDFTCTPLTRNILKIDIVVKSDFNWTNQRYHNEVEPYWIFVEDLQSGSVLFHKYFTIVRRNRKKEVNISCMIPIFEKNPGHKVIRVISDNWFGVEVEEMIDFKNIILPEKFPKNTELLKLTPLNVERVLGKKFQKYFPFPNFNPIQTQVFHSVYHTDGNILIGAATGSGKTVIADLAVLRCFDKNPKAKVVYVAPLKALVKEKMKHFTKIFRGDRRKIVELTGDSQPDIKLLYSSDIIVTTPEKWDGVSRNFKNRTYVQKIGLLIFDEIHLLGSERGATLEVIVSRMNYMSWFLGKPIRIVGLGTSMANHDDVKQWLRIKGKGSYNFKNSVRPVQLKTHIQGFSEKYYCPRMGTMNKPVFSSIESYSPFKPVLIFVSSRRQTRLTAQSVISQCINTKNPFKFSKLNDLELVRAQKKIVDGSLRDTIQYGIGIHHSGLVPSDRNLVEDLFLKNKIQVIVSTSTLAWGVNLPAHLVIVKGTEYFEVKMKEYVQYNTTDILQMMGRAGRPQFDNEGVVCIFVQEVFKDFYKKFLFDPFPVESYLHKNIHNHINAEISGGIITNRQDALDYVTWTFLFRRVLKNPTFYNLEDNSVENVQIWISGLIDGVISDLIENKSVKYSKVDDSLSPLKLGEISSYYYIDYKTAFSFFTSIGEKDEVTMKKLLQILGEAVEFNEIPVRHNEDQINSKLEDILPWKSYTIDYESPNLKTYLLIQSHFSRIKFPINDYITDLKTVLDSSLRIVQAFIDVAAFRGHLQTTMKLIQMLQMIMQGRWFNESSLLILPNAGMKTIEYLKRDKNIVSISQLVHLGKNKIFNKVFNGLFSRNQILQIWEVIQKLPNIEIETTKKDKGETIEIQVTFFRHSKISRHAYTPRFKKKKDEGFWVIIGGLKEGNKSKELLALKKVYLRKEKKIQLRVPAKTKDLVLYFFNDSYIGLDQQFVL